MSLTTAPAAAVGSGVAAAGAGVTVHAKLGGTESSSEAQAAQAPAPAWVSNVDWSALPYGTAPAPPLTPGQAQRYEEQQLANEKAQSLVRPLAPASASSTRCDAARSTFLPRDRSKKAPRVADCFLASHFSLLPFDWLSLCGARSKSSSRRPSRRRSWRSRKRRRLSRSSSHSSSRRALKLEEPRMCVVDT